MGRTAPSARSRSWRDPPPHTDEWAILEGAGRIQMPRFHRYRAVFELLEHIMRPELSAAPVARGEGSCGAEAWAAPRSGSPTTAQGRVPRLLRLGDRTQGGWPNIPPDRRHEYGIGRIEPHMALFLDRFFRQSQFKRSAIPNTPKVGSGGSLRPRGDYRAPSDSEAEPWLRQVELVPDQ